MFGDDAIKASKILQIQLTTRDKNSENAMPMCGIPVHALDRYLKKLITSGEKVAICDQVEDPAESTGIVKRELVRIVTPGTAFEEAADNPGSNTYIASVNTKPGGKYAVSFLDMSTGEFVCESGTEKESPGRLASLISIYNPKEILVDESNRIELKGMPHAVTHALGNYNLEFRDGYEFDFRSSEKLILEHYGVHSCQSLGLPDDKLLFSVIGSLISYIRATQVSDKVDIAVPEIITGKGYMFPDEITYRNLEVFLSSAERTEENTLFSVMNRTLSPMGSRRLRHWLGNPLADVNRISERYDAVQELISGEGNISGFRDCLKKIGDLERYITRIALPKVTPGDVFRLRDSLACLPDIKKSLSACINPFIRSRLDNIDTQDTLRDDLKRTLDENASTKLTEGNVIAKGFNADLDKFRELKTNARQTLLEMEAREKESSGIPNLKINYNKVFGYYIELTAAVKHKAPKHYIRRQTLVNAERFFTEELKELEESILTAEDKSLFLEKQIFDELVERILPNIDSIRKSSRLIGELDVLSSFAAVAVENFYCRPKLIETSENSGSRIEIKAGRHPVIEKIDAQQNPFIPNDLRIGEKEGTLHVITGPNMGGKSTFMRQAALIILMAQTGSFVPAESCTMSVFDKIFTRVGATDNLSRGQSTFMMEMTETAAILNRLSRRSFIILDEIGRGTGTYDGMSIASAIIEYLHEQKSLTLFATHYHELSELEKEFEGVHNYSVGVKEERDNVTFLCKIKYGPAGKSYGIHVARMAGLPEKVVRRAEKIVASFEKNSLDHLPTSSKIEFRETVNQYQPDLFSTNSDNIINKLMEVEPDTMSPLEALNFIHKLKEELILK